MSYDYGDDGLAEAVTNALASRKKNRQQNAFKNLTSQYQAAQPDQRDAIGAKLFATDPNGAQNFLTFQDRQQASRDAREQKAAAQTAHKLYAVANAPEGQAAATYAAIAPDHYKQMAASGQLTAETTDEQIRQMAQQHLPEFMAKAGMSTANKITSVKDGESLVSESPMGGAPKSVYSQPKEETFTPAPHDLMINGKPAVAQVGSRGTVRPVAGATPYRNKAAADRPPSGYRAKSDGTLEFIPGGPADPSAKNASSTGLGGRESVMFQRVINSANSATEALKNISELPVGASTGVYGVGASPGTSLFASAKGVLTNKIAPQEVQDYNTMLAGVGRNLATIETAGLAPNGSLTHSMDSIQLREGDTGVTKLRKLAEMRQIIVKGIETNTSNPKLPAEQKQLVEGIIKQVKEAIPFTQSDITKLQQKQNKNPNYTFQDLMKEKGLAPDQGPVKVSTPEEAMKLAPGTQFVTPDGRVKIR